MPEGSKPVPEELKKLVFLVARLFYEPRCVIILDIMTHVDSIKDEDLSAMIKIPTKELHKICGKLLEDKFIQMFTRQESKKADQRPVPKTYYVIDYRKIVDVVKWKLYQVKIKVNEKVLKAKESSGYKCPYCEKKYNVFDAIKFVDHDTGLFKCFDDDTELVVEVPEENNETEGLNALFNEQTRPIIELLKQTDDIQLEDVNLTSIKKSIEAKQNAQKSDTNSQLDISKDTGSNETKITVVILEDEQKTKEAQEAENERKRLQNAMPVWHVKSTVRPLHLRYARVPDKKSKDSKTIDNSVSSQLLKNGEYSNEPIFNEKDLENAQRDQKKRAKFYEQFYTMLNDTIETKKGIKRNHEQTENGSNNDTSNREDSAQGSAIESTA